jgi:hypothetical protein
VVVVVIGKIAVSAAAELLPKVAGIDLLFLHLL